MLMFRMLVLPLLLCVFASPLLATTLYQWKDASGHMHFTDSLAKVPVEYRPNSARQMKPLKSASKDAKSKVLDGRALYDNKCDSCHVIGYADDGAREGLAWAIIDQSTKYPHTRENLFRNLRGIVDGRIDMPIVDIGDDELMAITDYLIKESAP